MYDGKDGWSRTIRESFAEVLFQESKLRVRDTGSSDEVHFMEG